MVLSRKSKIYKSCNLVLLINILTFAIIKETLIYNFDLINEERKFTNLIILTLSIKSKFTNSNYKSELLALTRKSNFINSNYKS